MLKIFNRHLRGALLDLIVFYLRNFKGMTIGKKSRISTKAILDKTNPKGICIGDYSYIAFGATILTHDFVRNLHKNTVIGNHTFIGANCTILPGIKIGNHCIVGAGSIVVSDIPDKCIYAGNPAKLIKKGIKTGNYGKLIYD